MKINISPEDIRCLKLIVASSAVALIIVGIIFLVYSYRETLSSFSPRLSRKTIKNLYLVNSSRIACDTEEGHRITSLYYINEKDKRIYFNVSFIDWMWLWYQNIFYSKKKWKREAVESQKNNLEMILKSFQKDIEKLQKQSEKEIKDSKEITFDVLNRMR